MFGPTDRKTIAHCFEKQNLRVDWCLIRNKGSKQIKFQKFKKKECKACTQTYRYAHK